MSFAGPSRTIRIARGRMTSRPERILCSNQACRHMAYYHRGGEGICTYNGCQCGHYQLAPIADDMTIACANCPHIKGRHFRGGKPYCIPASGECECPGFATRVERFPAFTETENCKICGHQKRWHEKKCKAPRPFIGGNEQAPCGCPGFTKDEQFPSYSQSAQSEPPPQYEERPASSHYRCKYQHGRIAGDLLAHMASTSESNPLATPAQDSARLSQLLLALWKCGATECQDARTLVAQALSSQSLWSLNSPRKHTGSPKPSSQ